MKMTLTLTLCVSMYLPILFHTGQVAIMDLIESRNRFSWLSVSFAIQTAQTRFGASKCLALLLNIII